MTARAAWWAAATERSSCLTQAGTPTSKHSRPKGTPMTPVEATSTSSAAQPRASATMRADARATSRPCSPVAALALPEFRTTARAWPEAARGRETCTGAAQKRFLVKVPAQTQVLSATTSARSRRSGLWRKPAETPVARMPLAAQTPPSQGTKPKPSAAPSRSGTRSGSNLLMSSPSPCIAHILPRFRHLGPAARGPQAPLDCVPHICILLHARWTKPSTGR